MLENIWELLQYHLMHVTNATFRETNGCPPVSSVIQGRWLHKWHKQIPNLITIKLLVHPSTTISLEKALMAPVYHLAEGYRCWYTFGQHVVHSAWKKANNCIPWWRIIDKATLLYGAQHWRRILYRPMLFLTFIKQCYSIADSVDVINVM